jgi:TRAP-type uncharacterized transport system substrate-binding protein
MVRAIAIAGFLLLAAGAAAIAWFWFPWVFAPQYTIRIASGPVGSDAQKFIAAFKHELAEQRPRVRLALEETAGLKESAEALQSGKVDLAVVRSDHPAAASGGTLVIVRRIPLVVMVAGRSSVESITELVGKKIAVLDGTAGGRSASGDGDGIVWPQVDQSRQDIAGRPGCITSRQSGRRPWSRWRQTDQGRSPKPSRPSPRRRRKPPRFLDLSRKERRLPREILFIRRVDIPQGAFVVAPAIPGEEVTTVAVTVRLVARSSMLNYVAGEITRLLLATRAKLAATVPTAGEIEAPDTDKKGVLPVHPGAAAYLDGEQESLFEQAMTQLFNISIIGGILGSIAFGVNTLWRRHRAEETQKTVARLPAMLREAKSVPLGRLDEMEDELDTLSGWLLDRFVREHIAPERISGVAAIISEIRLAIERRRKVA